MRSRVFRKDFVIGVIILFLGMSITSSNASVNSYFSGNILHVGGNGPGNYTGIQNAIDDANLGDTVFVFDDSSPCYENIVVDKSISLIGEDKDTTTIDGSGSGNVVYMYGDWVNICGFTIQNSGSEPTDVGIQVRSNHSTISENIIENDGYDRVGRTLTGPTSHTTVHADHAYGGSGKRNIFKPLLMQIK